MYLLDKGHRESYPPTQPPLYYPLKNSVETTERVSQIQRSEHESVFKQQAFIVPLWPLEVKKTF